MCRHPSWLFFKSPQKQQPGHAVLPGRESPSPVCSSRQKQRNLNHEEGCGSPHPAPAGLKIPLSSPVFSLSTLQLAPLQTRDAGTASWPAQQVTEPLEREAHCPQMAKRHGRAEELARHTPEGCSAKHKGSSSPVLAALPWNAAWEPLPSTNLFLIILPGC